MSEFVREPAPFLITPGTAATARRGPSVLGRASLTVIERPPISRRFNVLDGVGRLAAVGHLDEREIREDAAFRGP